MINNIFHSIEFWKGFWVGLIDGNGNLQVNHWRRKYLQFRVVIKLKYTSANYEILTLLAKQLCFGKVSIATEKGDKYVIWVENRQSKIKGVLDFFKIYAPLTSRLQCQLSFFKEHFEKKDVSHYLKTRSLKYKNQEKIMQELQKWNVHTLNYFPSWLSGFIEAEGCFTKRARSSFTVSFSISQKKDGYLIESIKIFVGAQNKVRFIEKGNLYLLEVYRRSVLTFLSNHFKTYPLLGEKKNQYCIVIHKNMKPV